MRRADGVRERRVQPMAVVFVLSLAMALLGPVAAAGAVEPPGLLGI